MRRGRYLKAFGCSLEAMAPPGTSAAAVAPALVPQAPTCMQRCQAFAICPKMLAPDALLPPSSLPIYESATPGEPGVSTQHDRCTKGHGAREQLTADGDFTVQHSSDLKLKLNRGRNFLASAGKVREKVRQELEQWGRVGCPGGTRAFEKDARIPAGKHPPCSPISCTQTAMLFRVNRLIQLQRLEGFCSGARACTTFALGRSPRLEGAARKGDGFGNA